MKKVIIYTRVSTDEQKEKGFSLQDQLYRLRQYCQKQQYEIVAHYQDDHSAKNFNRPQFKKFLADVKGKHVKADTFLCVRMDRFSRNAYESMQMIQNFKKWGIELELLEGHFDLSTPENLIPFMLNMVLPQVENERRAINTKRGMRQAAKEGRWMGTPPKGYTFMRTGGKSILMPNPDARYITRAFKEMATGQFAMNILRKALVKEGFCCSKMQFTNILRNPAYLGMVKVPATQTEPQTYVEGLHDPLTDEKTFFAVQDLLNGRKRIVRKRSIADAHLPLRGFLECPRCQGNLTGSQSKSRNGNYHRYYHCQAGCKTRFRADEAHERFISYLASIKFPPEVTELYMASVREAAQGKQGTREENLHHLEREIAKLQTKLVTAEDRYLDDLIDLETFNRAKARYKQKIRALEEKQTEIQSYENDFEKYLEFGFSILENLPQFYQHVDIEMKQNLLGSIFPKKIRFQDNSYRTTQPHPAFEEISAYMAKLEGYKTTNAPQMRGEYHWAPPLGLEPRTY